MIFSKSYKEKLAIRWADRKMANMVTCIVFAISILISFSLILFMIAKSMNNNDGLIVKSLNFFFSNPTLLSFFAYYILFVVLIVLSAMASMVVVGTIFYLPPLIFNAFACGFLSLDDDEIFGKCINADSQDYDWMWSAVFIDERMPTFLFFYLAKLHGINTIKKIVWMLFWPILLVANTLLKEATEEVKTTFKKFFYLQEYSYQ